MIVTNVASLKPPICAKCEGLTKLCNSEINYFVMVWRCDECATDYDHLTGEEIVKIGRSVNAEISTYPKRAVSSLR